MDINEIVKLPEIQEFVKGEVYKQIIKNFEIEKEKTANRYKLLNKNVIKGQILFVGSSLMENFPINEMQLGMNLEKIIYNRAVSGYVTEELIKNIEHCIFDLEPSKIFINIGSNDIGAIGENGHSIENLIENYSNILKQIKDRLPDCEVFIMSYYPVNSVFDFGVDKKIREVLFATRNNKLIEETNIKIEKLAKTYGFNHINVNNGLFDMSGNLKSELSIEGIHLLPTAYEIIFENLKKYL